MATGNPWYSSVESALPQYIPLPLEAISGMVQQGQVRHDTNIVALDNVATGLASIESRLPKHQEYLANLQNNFRTESEELLAKHNYNASDPQFSREFSRIKNKYLNNPDLQVIQQANRAYDRNADIAAKLAAEGKLYINEIGTGLDQDGRLVNNIGQVRSVNTLEDWENRLRIAAGTKTEVGNKITNKPALEQASSEIMASIASGSPEINDLIQAYESRGMSREAAQNQVMQDVQRLSGQYAVSESTNWQKLNYEEGIRARRAAEAAQARKQMMVNTMLPRQGSVGKEDVNKDLIRRNDTFLKNIDKNGNLTLRYKKGQSIPLNREDFLKDLGLVEGEDYIKRSLGNSDTPGGGYQIELLKNLDGNISSNNLAEYITEIKSELGVKNSTKETGLITPDMNNRQILELYNERLKLDNTIPTFWESPVKEVRDNMTRMYAGNGEMLNDAVFISADGKNKLVANGKINLSEFTNISYAGMTAVPIKADGATFEGGMEFMAIDKDGKPVSFIKPLPRAVRDQLSFTLNNERVLKSGLSNKQLENNPEYHIMGLIPQKKKDGISLYTKNSKGELVLYNESQYEQILRNELQFLGQFHGLHENTL